MKSYLPGQALNLTVALADSAGAAASATAVSFRVLDAAGAEVQASTPVTIPVPPVSSVVLAILQATNTLGVGVTSAPRQVEITVTTAAGQFIQNEYYALVQGDGLIVGVNTIATMLEANFIGFDMSWLDGWHSALPEARLGALKASRDDLCRLTYRYSPEDDQTRIVHTPGLFTIDLKDYDAAELAALPADFLAALKKAQVLQADYRLAGSTTERQREDGLMSRTVGESSEMYRPGMGPIKYPVCKAAMAALSGYLEMNRWIIGRG